MVGLSREQWLAGKPPLTADNEQVLKVWRFCEGWDPALLPLAAAYYDITDVDFLLGQLELLRDKVEAHRESARTTGNG